MLMLPPSTTPHLDRLPSYADLEELLDRVAPYCKDLHHSEAEGRMGSTVASREVGGERGDLRCCVSSLVLDDGRIDIRVIVYSKGVETWNLERAIRYRKTKEVLYCMSVLSTTEAAMRAVVKELVEFGNYRSRTGNLPAAVRAKARDMVNSLPARKAS